MAKQRVQGIYVKNEFLWEWVKKFAHEEGKSMSTLIEDIIEEYKGKHSGTVHHPRFRHHKHVSPESFDSSMARLKERLKGLK